MSISRSYSYIIRRAAFQNCTNARFDHASPFKATFLLHIITYIQYYFNSQDIDNSHTYIIEMSESKWPVINFDNEAVENQLVVQLGCQ